MTTQKWILGFGVLAVLHCYGLSAFAQEPTLPPPASPARNLIDPSALNDAPAFGDSGPVIKSEESDAKVEVTPENGTRWMPKLQALLVTSFSEQAEVQELTVPSNDNTFFPTDGHSPAVRQTTRMINIPFRKSVVLTCDDVHVEATSAENGELTYSFSCKGRAMLTFSGYTVTGNSIISSDGKLLISNAVIKNDQVTMTSENLVLELPIVGVQVGATNQSDFLKSIPDVIGGAKATGKQPVELFRGNDLVR